MFAVLNRVDLPPGRYQVRAAARDAGKNRRGLVIDDLEVPDFYKQNMSMSGVMLTSLAGAAMMTAKPDEQLKAVLPAPPIGLRTFPQNDEIALFTEIYDNSGQGASQGRHRHVGADRRGQAGVQGGRPARLGELAGAKGGYGYTTRVPLSDIPPGLYVLNVEARSRLGNDNVVTRGAPSSGCSRPVPSAEPLSLSRAAARVAAALILHPVPSDTPNSIAHAGSSDRQPAQFAAYALPCAVCRFKDEVELPIDDSEDVLNSHTLGGDSTWRT